MSCNFEAAFLTEFTGSSQSLQFDDAPLHLEQLVSHVVTLEFLSVPAQLSSDPVPLYLQLLLTQAFLSLQLLQLVLLSDHVLVLVDECLHFLIKQLFNLTVC